MPNAATHRFGAAVTLAVAAAHEDQKNGVQTSRLLAAACAGVALGTLPDVLEPALHPNHRDFFHSLACAGLIGLVFHRLYRWETKTEGEALTRFLLLAAGGAFLTHLAMDAFTSKGLPLVGRV